MSDLDTLIPQPSETAIQPVRMRNLQPAIRAALPIISDLREGKLDLERLKTMDWFYWIEAYARHGDALTEVVAYLTGTPLDEALDWTPDVAITYATRAVRANLDFFASLARQIGAPVATTASPTPGPTPSSD
jgi:hypothetical protein